METFKVGDEVEITGVDLPDPYSVGARGKIVRKSIVGWWIKFESGEYNTLNGSTWVALEGQLRHVPPAPPAAPAVTSRAAVLDVEGVEYTAVFALKGDYTVCTIFQIRETDDEIQYRVANGGTKRNPRDTYSEAVGMRQAMKRACGIGEPYAHQLPAVYRAFRKWQHDQAAPQPKQVKPLEVGAEVVAVKDMVSVTDNRLFKKDAIGKIVKYRKDGEEDKRPWLVQWHSGTFRTYGASFGEPANSWWASADEIEAV